VSYTFKDIAGMIDHALLKPALTVDRMEQGIHEALKYQVASVCVLPYYLKRCAILLNGSNVKASTTIGFPHGTQHTKMKIAEAEQALNDGGRELDVVVNISQVLTGNWQYVRSELNSIIEIAHARNQKVKVIFENCYLQDDHKIRLCEICAELNADWVKTSTGFGTSGATVEDVMLMRKHSPEHVQIKAAGGIRTLEKLLSFRQAGASRVGTSHTAEILEAYLSNHKGREEAKT
jgi:deoxyribose-phosphate aldolase